jgi:hypothetical protein
MLILDLVDLTAVPLAGPRDDVYKGAVPRRMKFLHPTVVDDFLALLQDAPFLAFTDVYRDPKASLAARLAGKRGVQRPGFSAHNFGFAVDVAVEQVLKDGAIAYSTLLEIMGRRNFSCHRSDGKLGFESWHFSHLKPFADAKAHPGASGPQKWIAEVYGAQLDGDEAWTQTLLGKLGLYKGPVDGDFGPKSRAALRQFEQDWGLPVDGIPDAVSNRTLAAVTAEKRVVVYGPPLTS